MCGNGREARPDIRKWSGDTSGYPGVVGRHFRISLSIWETLPDVREWWEALPNVRKCLEDTLACLGMVGRPVRIFESGRKTLPDIRE